MRFGGFGVVVGLLLLWEWSVQSGAVHSESWPALSKVLAALASGFRGEGWAQVFGSSLYRLACGYAIAVACGVTVGLLIGASRRANAVLNPTIEIFRIVPIPALVPPLIFLLGLEDALKITVIALASFFPIAQNTAAGVKAIDPVHLLVARTFRFPRHRIVLGIQLPSALPYVFAGCRVSLGIALIVTVVTEMLAGSEGVGYYIVSMQYAIRPDYMYAAIILLSVAGYLLNRLFLVAEARSIRWARVLESRRDG